MPQTNEGILIVVGALLLFIGLLGGEFEISAIKIPSMGKYPRIFSSSVGAVLLIVAVVRLFFPPLQANVDATPTSTVVVAAAPIATSVSPTDTSTPEPTFTPTLTSTPIPSNTPILTPTPTSVVPTNTPSPSPTPTQTPIPPIPTHTSTAIPPTATPIPPTNTPLPPPPPPPSPSYGESFEDAYLWQPGTPPDYVDSGALLVSQSTVHATEGQNSLKFDFAIGGDKIKAVFFEGIDLDLDPFTELSFDMYNDTGQPLRLSLAVSTADESGRWIWHESRQLLLGIGDNRDVTFRLDGSDYKTEASGWEHRVPIDNMGETKSLAIVILPYGDLSGSVYLDNLLLR